MSKTIIRIYRFSESIGKFSGKLSAILLMILTTVILWGVVTRFLFNSPSAWADTYAIYTLIALVFVGASYTMQKNQHVGVDIFVNRLNKRQKSVIEIIMLILALVYVIYLTYLTADLAYTSFLSGKRDIGLIRTPMFIPQSFLPVGSLLLSITILGKIMKNICILNNWIKPDKEA